MRGTSSTEPQPKKFHVRIWLLCLFLVVAAVPALMYWYLLRTDYSPGFTKAGFEEVRIGEPMGAVLGRLKAPVNFAIISLRDDDSRYKPQYSDDVSSLSQWAGDESVMLILRYSKPRVQDGSYRAYEIWLTNGVVQEKRAFNWWD
ncbi:MAG: hypothetical protein KIS67_28855 [Verrucomicrobiae bacterium]|nr:hypothetical protein [Verrucomicrobiae bacterium]